MTVELVQGDDRSFAQVDGAYTLFNRIALVEGPDGDIWAQELWAKDIALHEEYIRKLRLCAPVYKGAPPDDFVRLKDHSAAEIVPLRHDRGWANVAKNLIPNALRVFRAVKSSDIIHSGGAGWPFPVSFYLTLFRAFLKRPWIIIIESMPWLVQDGETPTLRKRLGQAVNAFVLKRAVRMADIRIFTHPGFRDYFLAPGAEAFINPATWIDEEKIIESDALTARHARRASSEGDRAVQLVFAARLAPGKGVETLVEAIDTLSASETAVSLTIIGDGPLREMLKEWGETQQGSVSVSLLDPIPYDADFFEFLGRFDALLSLSTGNEQPRIIFDAFSQGVPVIASSTSGNLSIISEDNALTFQPGDAAGLAARISAAAADMTSLQAKGLAGLQAVKGRTHKEMHRNRSKYIAQRLADLAYKARVNGS